MFVISTSIFCLNDPLPEAITIYQNLSLPFLNERSRFTTSLKKQDQIIHVPSYFLYSCNSWKNNKMSSFVCHIKFLPHFVNMSLALKKFLGLGSVFVSLLFLIRVTVVSFVGWISDNVHIIFCSDFIAILNWNQRIQTRPCHHLMKLSSR